MESSSTAKLGASTEDLAAYRPLSIRMFLLLLGIALLIVGTAIGLQHVYDYGSHHYCGQPFNPYGGSAECRDAMGSKQLITWLLIGVGIVLFVFRATLPRPVKH